MCVCVCVYEGRPESSKPHLDFKLVVHLSLLF